MSDFKFAVSYWVLEFDGTQTGLFVDDETMKEIEFARNQASLQLWVTDIYGVDFLLDPSRLYLAHKTTPETRLKYRLHNESIEAEKRELGPWSPTND